MADTSPSPALSPTPSSPPASTSDIVHATNLSTCVLVVLLLIWCLGGHHFAKKIRYLTEGSAACALGLVTGLLLLLLHHYRSWTWVTQLLEFNAAGFFTYLLPPVIFYCGLSVEHERFFYALPSILMYGVFGTLTSFAIISVFMYGALGFALFKMEDCLAMGAIFAATDSVATLQVLDRSAMPGLFSLVFGEGVVNDAVSVVLLGAVANTARAREAAAAGQTNMNASFVLNFVYLLVTSLLLGTASGLGVAMALKRLSIKDAHQEMAVIALLSYFSYLLADVTGLSGILTLFVCGVVVSHYALHNVSQEGSAATMTGFRTASYLAEGIIFIYVGMDALDPLKWQAANAAEALWLVVVLTVLLAAARAAFVVPFSLLHNCWSADKLTSKDIVVIWWAGLMRGAVSVALVYYYFDDNPRQMLDRGRATLIVSTLMVVMLSILGFGALTKPLLAAMLKSDKDSSLRDQLRTIPLLSNLAQDGSSANLLIQHLDSSFGRSRRGGTSGAQGSPHITPIDSTADITNNSRGESQYNSTVMYNRAMNEPHHVQNAGHNTSGAWGHGSSAAGSGSNTHTANSTGSNWLSRSLAQFSIGHGRHHAAASANPTGRGAAAAGYSAVPATDDGGFTGFNIDDASITHTADQKYDLPPSGADVAGIDGGGDIAGTNATETRSGGSHSMQLGDSSTFGRYLGQAQPEISGQPAFEMQTRPRPTASADVSYQGGTVLGAMRQVGQAWGAFDRDVMQPMFGGPATPTTAEGRGPRQDDSSMQQAGNNSNGLPL